MHGIFDGRHFAAGGRTLRRHQIAGGSQHEQLPRFGLREHIRIDAGIRAGDEQRQRPLAGAKPVKQGLLRAEDPVLKVEYAFDDAGHGISLDLQGATRSLAYRIASAGKLQIPKNSTPARQIGPALARVSPR